jgi:hypothetical protein
MAPSKLAVGAHVAPKHPTWAAAGTYFMLKAAQVRSAPAEAHERRANQVAQYTSATAR